MAGGNRLPDDEAQSFVVRVWSEGPGRWQGKISHVQSGVNQGFTRLSQAVGFMEQRAGWHRREPVGELEPQPAQSGRFHVSWLSRRTDAPGGWRGRPGLPGHRRDGALPPSGSSSLAGTAVGADLDFEPVLAFVAGAVAGGAALGVVLGRRGR